MQNIEENAANYLPSDVLHLIYNKFSKRHAYKQQKTYRLYKIILDEMLDYGKYKYKDGKWYKMTVDYFSIYTKDKIVVVMIRFECDDNEYKIRKLPLDLIDSCVDEAKIRLNTKLFKSGELLEKTLLKTRCLRCGW